MFSDRLKYLRSTEDLTQRDLANKLGITSGAVGMYESGKRFPDNPILNKIADYFHVSTDYLLGRTDDPTPVRDVDQDLHDEHDYNKELDDFLKDDEMSSMFYDYKNWTEEEKRNLLNILKGQEALRELNNKK